MVGAKNMSKSRNGFEIRREGPSAEGGDSVPRFRYPVPPPPCIKVNINIRSHIRFKLCWQFVNLWCEGLKVNWVNWKWETPISPQLEGQGCQGFQPGIRDQMLRDKTKTRREVQVYTANCIRFIENRNKFTCNRSPFLTRGQWPFKLASDRANESRKYFQIQLCYKSKYQCSYDSCAPKWLIVHITVYFYGTYLIP